MTEIKFKQGKKKHSFFIINKSIKSIDCETINLIIDFLKHIKIKSSSIIHIQDKDIKIQKEILYEYLGEQIDNNKENNKINIKDIIQIIFEKTKEKERTIYKKNSKSFEKIKSLIQKEIKDDSTIIIEKKEVNFDSEDEAERIKNVIMGKENQINTNLSFQLKKLIEKIELNQEIIKFDAKKNETKAVDGIFFYNSWINSFNTEKFKMHSKFRNFIKKEKISSLANMGFYLKTLLDDFYIDIYVDDPNQLDKALEKNN